MRSLNTGLTGILRTGPCKTMINIVTLWSFLFGSISGNLVWAANIQSGPTRVGSDQPGGSDISLDTVNISVPLRFGEITEVIKGSNGKTIIHIQDAHCDYGAQMSIDGIINYLTGTYNNVRLVSLEGGKGGYDLSMLTGIENVDTRKKVADYFVKDGVVSGPEYFAINNPGKVELFGIEDEILYRENLAAYRNSLPDKSEADKCLNALSNALTNLKMKSYSARLKELDEKMAGYKKGSVDFKEYIIYLSEIALREGLDIKGYKNVVDLLSVIGAEKEIDFKEADRERNKLIDVIGGKVSKKDMGEIVIRSAQFKMGDITSESFYSYLFKLAKFSGADFGAMPNLVKYSAYVKKYEALDRPVVLDEVGAIEKALFDKMADNDDQKAIYSLDEDLAVIKDIINISLVKDGFDRYMSDKDAFRVKRFADFINAKAPLYGLSFTINGSVEKLDQYRENMEKFYQYSLKRDDAFIKNIGKKLDDDKKNVTILVTGGFHTGNLSRMFKENEYSYIEVMPKFAGAGDESPYMKLLAGGKTPIATVIDKAVERGAKGSAIAIQSLFSQMGLDDVRAINEMSLQAKILEKILSSQGEPVEFWLRLPDGEMIMVTDSRDSERLKSADSIVESGGWAAGIFVDKLPEGTEFIDIDAALIDGDSMTWEQHKFWDGVGISVGAEELSTSEESYIMAALELMGLSWSQAEAVIGSNMIMKWKKTLGLGIKGHQGGRHLARKIDEGSMPTRTAVELKDALVDTFKDNGRIVRLVENFYKPEMSRDDLAEGLFDKMVNMRTQKDIEDAGLTLEDKDMLTDMLKAAGWVDEIFLDPGLFSDGIYMSAEAASLLSAEFGDNTSYWEVANFPAAVTLLHEIAAANGSLHSANSKLEEAYSALAAAMKGSDAQATVGAMKSLKEVVRGLLTAIIPQKTYQLEEVVDNSADITSDNWVIDILGDRTELNNIKLTSFTLKGDDGERARRIAETIFSSTKGMMQRGWGIVEITGQDGLSFSVDLMDAMVRGSARDEYNFTDAVKGELQKNPAKIAIYFEGHLGDMASLRRLRSGIGREPMDLSGIDVTFYLTPDRRMSGEDGDFFAANRTSALADIIASASTDLEVMTFDLSTFTPQDASAIDSDEIAETSIACGLTDSDDNSDIAQRVKLFYFLAGSSREAQIVITYKSGDKTTMKLADCIYRDGPHYTSEMDSAVTAQATYIIKNALWSELAKRRANPASKVELVLSESVEPTSVHRIFNDVGDTQVSFTMKPKLPVSSYGRVMNFAFQDLLKAGPDYTDMYHWIGKTAITYDRSKDKDEASLWDLVESLYEISRNSGYLARARLVVTHEDGTEADINLQRNVDRRESKEPWDFDMEVTRVSYRFTINLKEQLRKNPTKVTLVLPGAVAPLARMDILNGISGLDVSITMKQPDGVSASALPEARPASAASALTLKELETGEALAVFDASQRPAAVKMEELVGWLEMLKKHGADLTQTGYADFLEGKKATFNIGVTKYEWARMMPSLYGVKGAANQYVSKYNLGDIDINFFESSAEGYKSIGEEMKKLSDEDRSRVVTFAHTEMKDNLPVIIGELEENSYKVVYLSGVNEGNIKVATPVQGCFHEAVRILNHSYLLQKAALSPDEDFSKDLEASAVNVSRGMAALVGADVSEDEIVKLAELIIRVGIEKVVLFGILMPMDYNLIADFHKAEAAVQRSL